TPRTSAVGTVTRIILASGAMACAHSTSNETSTAHRLWFSCPVPLLGGGGLGGGDPWTCRMVKVGIPAVQVPPASPQRCGRPNWVLKLFKSLAIVALPNESITAIVFPLPVN